jgi:glutamine phosphoribosylpyrophosphate amidotransferase
VSSAFSAIPNAAELTYYGLYALQHRGQESAGIVTSDGRNFRAHRGMGLVSQIFQRRRLAPAHRATWLSATRVIRRPVRPN